MSKISGSTEFLFDHFENAKSVVKRNPYITAGIVVGSIIILFVLFKLIAGSSNEPNAEKLTHGGFEYFTIFDAIEKGTLEDVEAILNMGVDPNEQNDVGDTPLHFAIRRGNEEIARVLLEKGANGNIQNDEGFSPLALAVKHNQHDIAHLILQDVNFGIASWNKDILGHHTCNMTDKLADAFKKRGVNTTFDAESELQKSVKNGDVNKTEAILEKCIGNINGNKKYLPLTSAAHECKIKIASMLVNKGADVNKANPDGWRALHVAVYNDCKEIIKLLIDHHADVNCLTNYGHSPLCIAKRQENKEVVDMLEKAGATKLCSF